MTTSNITKAEELLAQSYITKIRDLQTVCKLYSNWLEVLQGGRPKSIVKREGNTITYICNGEKVYLKCTDELDTQEAAMAGHEVFTLHEYKRLKPLNRIIIDVGASIGDTAIYFALNGARHVYSFEPQPWAYKRAMENIKLNHLQSKVSILNEAVGPKRGSIRLGNGRSYGGTKLEDAKKGQKIKVITLHDIIQRYSLKGAELKLDVEGGEYDILLQATMKDLQSFNHVICEYHYGYLNLQRKLENAGFIVYHTKPRLVTFDKNARIGILFAINRDKVP